MQIRGSTDEQCKRLGSANSEHVASTSSLLARSCTFVWCLFLVHMTRFDRVSAQNVALISCGSIGGIGKGV